MAQKPDMDQGLSDAELLAMPAENVSPDALVRVWELHARHTEEQAQEATAINFQHRMVEQKVEHEREEGEYQTTMRQVRDRTERLLEDIDREERRLERRRDEIDARAIRLKDGRRVYVDGNGYRDGEGRALTGADHAEADAGRAANSATWQEQARIDRQCEAARKLKEKTLEFQNKVSRETYGNDSGDKEGRAAKNGVAGLEQEFKDHTRDNSAVEGRDFGSADYGAYKTTSFAHAIAPGDDKPLRTDFAPVSDGRPSERLKTAPVPLPAPGVS